VPLNQPVLSGSGFGRAVTGGSGNMLAGDRVSLALDVSAIRRRDAGTAAGDIGCPRPAPSQCGSARTANSSTIPMPTGSKRRRARVPSRRLGECPTGGAHASRGMVIRIVLVLAKRGPRANAGQPTSYLMCDGGASTRQTCHREGAADGANTPIGRCPPASSDAMITSFALSVLERAGPCAKCPRWHTGSGSAWSTGPGVGRHAPSMRLSGEASATIPTLPCRGPAQARSGPW
jgi:hypothetical protein